MLHVIRARVCCFDICGHVSTDQLHFDQFVCTANNATLILNIDKTLNFRNKPQTIGQICDTDTQRLPYVIVVTAEKSFNTFDKSESISYSCYLRNRLELPFLFLFFALFFLSHSIIFQSYGDVTITAEGLHILTFARHSWPLNSEGLLACNTNCDTGHPFIMVIPKYP